MLAAVAAADVPALVVASSIGVYSPGPKQRVDESWPREGIQASWYSRHKAELERRLDRFESEQATRVVRLRPALIMKRESAESVRRLFTGPFLPSPLVKPGRLPVFPHIPGAVVQLVHSLDVGEAYRLAATRDVRGAFNIAAEPEVDGRTDRRRDRRPLADDPGEGWRARSPRRRGAPGCSRPRPTGSTSRSACRCSTARAPAKSSAGRRTRDGLETIRELLQGLADRAGGPTPPLRIGDRLAEIRAGVGGKSV